jgi:hypothetical protein
VANKNFNFPDRTPRPWTTEDMMPACCPPSSILSLPLAQICKKDEDAQWVEWLERLYKLGDRREEKTD